MTSDKLEDYARTIRPKINNQLPEYLIYFPTIKPRTNTWGDSNRSVDWDKLIEHVTREGDEVPEGVDKFLDELIVWGELADNFCYYEPHYDSLKHLEKAQTTDPLWNASQLEMVHHEKMHVICGKMYWAKKIFEWTSSPQEAVEIAVYLNEKVCAYESMLAGMYRLKRLGISLNHPAGLSSTMNQLPDEAIALAAASHIECELQITPLEFKQQLFRVYKSGQRKY
ncbi:putative deoxyribodipyrimidine photo-lyase [Helianthus annuus]|nr:putative deoxyribodipyrimidine photo-lyase [Helianthus annuus]